LAGLTALQALQRGGVKAGSKVFITAGLGGVGSFAVQLAAKVCCLLSVHVASNIPYPYRFIFCTGNGCK
jgi:NADPH:quinone reductase-like Zn-dependent oxidoreductase